ncbi:MAG: DUF4405 domain-containing protein [Gemmatimonadaceae bacterium]
MPQGEFRSRIEQWRRPLLLCVSSLLVFETLTGLAIFLLPFSVPNQVSVLLHTGIGLACVLPFLWYQYQHWQLYRDRAMTHVKLTGYFALISALLLTVSGLVLSYQAGFGTRISYAWDLLHIVATFALVAATVPHLVILARYALASQADGSADLRLAQRRWSRQTALAALALTAVVGVGTIAYRPVSLNNRLPSDYSYVYGPERPFAPSLARTRTGQAFDARSMGGSKGCGVAGCHDQIYREWSVSAHRYAAMDAGFRAIQTTMGQQNGPESTRYCAGCHDPISLFAGTKNLFATNSPTPSAATRACPASYCHSIQETDVKGNASSSSPSRRGTCLSCMRVRELKPSATS